MATAQEFSVISLVNYREVSFPWKRERNAT
jgi:hypothetical protein